MEDLMLDIREDALIDVINFDKNTSWIRWYTPDMSANGNIDLPTGKNYKLKNRIGRSVILCEQ